MQRVQFATFYFFIALACFVQQNRACEPCLENKLTSNGDFGKFYPRFLGTWVYSGDWDGNPFYTCIDCQGLRAFIVSFTD